jgi:uncharacterized protein (UPF0332 family)
MKFNWSQYIDVADSLGKMANQREEGREAFYRAGISRSYYAAFNVTKSALDFDSPQGREHDRLIAYLLEQDSSEMKKIGHMLKRLRIKRVDADYRQTSPITENDLLLSIRNSRQILDMLGR